MNRILIILALGALAIIGIVWARRASPHVGTHPLPSAGKLRVGQQWRFVGRPNDPDPTLIVALLERDPRLGIVAHVSIRGVRLRNPDHPDGVTDRVNHMPYALAAVETSVTDLVADSVALPDFEEGYRMWKDAEGGAFTVSVHEGLDFIEQTIGGPR